MRRDANKKAEETRKRIADIKKNPGNWVSVGAPVVRPALGKKYNMGSLDIKKQNYTIGESLLSNLEHSILGTTLNDSEPLHILYKDARCEFENLSFDSFIEALIKLFNLGYVEAKIEEIGEPETELTKEGLLAHYGGGLSEKEIDIYPDVVEYYFKATPKGVKEEAKDVYNAYYPD